MVGITSGTIHIHTIDLCASAGKEMASLIIVRELGTLIALMLGPVLSPYIEDVNPHVHTAKNSELV